MKLINTILIALLLVALSVTAAFAADPTNVFMYVNWADGSEGFAQVEQGASVTVNYESFTPFPANVDTNVYLVQDYDFDNPIQTLIDRTDVYGHYGFVTVDTSSLALGEYSIYGIAQENVDGTTNTGRVDFEVVEFTGTNQAPVFANNIPTTFTYYASVEDDELFRISNYVTDADGDILTYSLDLSSTDSAIAQCNTFFDSAIHCDILNFGITTFDVVVSDGFETIRQEVTIQVLNDNGENTAPYFVGLTTFEQIGLTEGAITIDNIADHAVDNEADALTYSLDLSSTDENIASCTLNNNNIVCDGLAVGATSIVAVANDGAEEGRQTITLQVYDDLSGNDAPYFNGLDTYFAYPIGQGAADVIDLATVAFDANNDPLTYSLTQADATAATCSISGASTIHCDFNELGTTQIVAIASDGELEARQPITVRIQENSEFNNAPFFSGLPVEYAPLLSDGNGVLVDLADYASDIDGDALSYAVSTTGTDLSVVSCAIQSGSELFCNFLSGGTTTVEVSVTDGEFTDSRTVVIDVRSVADNNAPYFNGLNTFYSLDVQDGSRQTLVDLANHGRDADNNALTYNVVQSSTAVVDCDIELDSVLVCDLITEDITSFIVEVSDGIETTQATVTVQVFNSASNTPPSFDASLITSYILGVSETRAIVDLADYASDADGDTLSYSIRLTNTDTNVVDCSIAGSIITCEGLATGVTTIEAVASDGTADTTRILTIDVGGVGVQFLDTIPLFHSATLSAGTANLFALPSYVTGGSGTLSYSVSGEDIAIADCDLNAANEIICALNGVGTTSFTVEVTDGSSTDTETITLEVVANNGAPVFNNLSTFFEYELSQGTATVMDIANFAVDPEGDALTYGVDLSSTDTSVITCAIASGSELFCNLVGLGTTTVDITVSDAYSTTTETITIRVVDVLSNNPPSFVAMPTIFTYNLTPTPVVVIDLAGYASDLENDPLTFGVDQTGNDFSVIDCVLDNGSEIVCNINGIGTQTINATVSDGEYTVHQTLVITVVNSTTPLDGTVAIIDGASLAVIGYSETYSGANSIGGNGTAIVDYSWVINEDGIVTAQSGVSPTIAYTFTNIGVHSVALTVTDEDGNMGTSTLFVDAQDENPVAVFELNDRVVVDQTTLLDGSDSYAKLGATITNYSWVIRDSSNTIVDVLAGQAVNYAFPDQGDYTVELMVTDSANRTGFTTIATQARHGVEKPTRDYDPEEGIFVESFDVSGYDFERAIAGGYIEVNVKVKNVADEDLDNVRLTMIIPELGIKEKSRALDLDEGERGTLSLYTELPYYTEPGVYYPQISISDGDIRRVKIAYLEVEE